MSSIINASTSGGGGIIQTADASGILELQSGGTTKLAVSSTGPSLTWPDSTTAQTRFGWERIAADVVPSSVASVDFTSIPSSVTSVKIIFNLIPATNGTALMIRFSQSGSFVTSASYPQTNFFAPSTGGASNGSATNTGFQPAGTVYSPSGGTYPGIGGEVVGLNLQVADKFQMNGSVYGIHTGDGYSYLVQSGISFAIAGAIDGFRLLFSSGNIASGRISILGLRS